MRSGSKYSIRRTCSHQLNDQLCPWGPKLRCLGPRLMAVGGTQILEPFIRSALYIHVTVERFVAYMILQSSLKRHLIAVTLKNVTHQAFQKVQVDPTLTSNRGRKDTSPKPRLSCQQEMAVKCEICFIWKFVLWNIFIWLSFFINALFAFSTVSCEWRILPPSSVLQISFAADVLYRSLITCIVIVNEATHVIMRWRHASINPFLHISAPFAAQESPSRRLKSWIASAWAWLSWPRQGVIKLGIIKESGHLVKPKVITLFLMYVSTLFENELDHCLPVDICVHACWAGKGRCPTATNIFATQPCMFVLLSYLS